jgi:lipoprotein NlpD
MLARTLAAVLCGALLAACGAARPLVAAGHEPAQETEATARVAPPVHEQSKSLREPETAVRTVVPGDTLYSIAWETGRDYRELAAWNRIPPPYTIKPGQDLRVVPPIAENKTRTVDRTKAAVAAPRKPTTTKSTAATKQASPGATSGAVTKKGATAATRTAAVAAGQGVKKAPAATPKGKRKEPAKTKVEAPKARSQPDRVASGGGTWSWPADGTVLNRYSESDSKGVDISGARGAAVRAAAGGRVVYQGSGLRGYGQLIIVKHSDEFLSAYAHNDRIYVKEGDVVKRGQKIADMGSTGTDRVKLHFEIRRQGVPIDPLKYLPKR